MHEITVGVIYPTDPAGKVIGGIDTFIRGLIRYAPEDIRYVVYGATTDIAARPIRRWAKCQLGNRSFDFFPVMRMDGSGRQPRIPATLVYEFAALVGRPDYKRCDILESHRIEHVLLRRTCLPINLFLHQDMSVLALSSSDIRWRVVPGLYPVLERRALYRASSVFCVRAGAVENYKRAYPSIGDKVRFQSTWMDPEIFYPATASERMELRERLSRELLAPHDRRWLVAVGRLDHQKDPLLMVRALERVVKNHPNTHLIWVGEGVLKEQVRKEANTFTLAGNITLAGLLRPEQVARVLKAADLFVMSSAYEGMPIALIEAMGCGLPVVTTDVGEVRRLVVPGYNGEICPVDDVDALAAAIEKASGAIEQYAGAPCVEFASKYTPQNVLGSVYDNYRKLVGKSALNQ